ncbi:aminopeptidase [Marinicrinis sediminis]|uniref:Aminopeptidase n=1 Tax=Marinicrinis sediminis TaxID=1652465 RepID=A0ABW5R5H5_9BACL
MHTDSFQSCLEAYAQLVIEVGVNLQTGQLLRIEAPVEAAELTRWITQKAYQAGAKYVDVHLHDEQLSRIRFEHGHSETFGYYPEWQASGLEMLAEQGGAFLSIKVPNPDLYNGIDPAAVRTATQAAMQARQGFSQYTRNHRISWCLIKAPTIAWANKVYADLPEEERVEAMWQDIFKMNRVDQLKPADAWRAHMSQLQSRLTLLNDRRYKRLHYRAPGTDLSVELPADHLWAGGGAVNADGHVFVPNMPTEEVFTMPHRLGVNGTVTSTMPLNLNGQLIDQFTLTFQNGRITSYTAETGQEALASIIETDEGASYLGEIALVPHDSPISNLNRVFYNTGIDENASCHLAIGSAYPINLEKGITLRPEELLAKGANVSLTHVDFMIGSAELDIDGETEDGELEPLFRKGNWV